MIKKTSKITLLLVLTFFLFLNLSFVSSDEFNITNCTDLDDIPDGDGMTQNTYYLINNIDCLGYMGFVGAGYFEGTLDGQGYNITNLFVNTTYAGLFQHLGMMNYATIRNVGLINATIIGTTATGGIAGMDNVGSYINNVFVTGTIEGMGNSVTGGLFGSSNGYIINNSYFIGEIKGVNRTGGLIGEIDLPINIYNSYFIGNITGGDKVGGILGTTWGGNANIQNCSAIGNIFGTNYLGGLVGYIDFSSKIENSYAEINIFGTDYLGGLIGNIVVNSGDIFVKNSYAVGDIHGVSDIGGLIGFAEYNTTIYNSFFKGNLNGSGRVGGLIGEIVDMNMNFVVQPSIVNSYAVGDIYGLSSIGGLIGYNLYVGEIKNSYAVMNITPINVSLYEEEGGWSVGGIVGDDGFSLASGNSAYWNKDYGLANHSTGCQELFCWEIAVSKTTLQMVQEATFTDWDFVNIWQIDENVTYPYLFFESEGYSPFPEPEPEEPEEEPAYLSDPIYQIMESSGAGLGIFLTSFGQGVGGLLIVFVIISIIAIIGYAIIKAIPHMIKNWQIKNEK